MNDMKPNYFNEEGDVQRRETRRCSLHQRCLVALKTRMRRTEECESGERCKKRRKTALKRLRGEKRRDTEQRERICVMRGGGRQ